MKFPRYLSKVLEHLHSKILTLDTEVITSLILSNNKLSLTRNKAGKVKPLSSFSSKISRIITTAKRVHIKIIVPRQIFCKIG